jgi:hypothetical protein
MPQPWAHRNARGRGTGGSCIASYALTLGRPALCPGAAQLANAWLGLVDPFLMACAVNVVVVFGYLHYVVTVVGEICAFLDIPCLTIPKKKPVAHAE